MAQSWVERLAKMAQRDITPEPRGMQFNPRAQLDPSQIKDWRGGISEMIGAPAIHANAIRHLPFLPREVGGYYRRQQFRREVRQQQKAQRKLERRNRRMARGKPFPNLDDILIQPYPGPFPAPLPPVSSSMAQSPQTLFGR